MFECLIINKIYISISIVERYTDELFEFCVPPLINIIVLFKKKYVGRKNL